MKKIDPSNAVIRHRPVHTQQNENPCTRHDDNDLDKRVTLRRHHPNPEPVHNQQSRQLIEYQCSSDPEGQCQHCRRRHREEHNDDIQMMDEDNIHSDEDSSDDDQTSCFAKCFGCCFNIPWKTIGIGALIAAASASMGFAANSHNTPTGTVLSFAGTIESIPSGYLLCDGSLLSREEHRKLFSAIGTTYNIGDENELQFRLPNYYKKFLQGDKKPGIVKEPGLPNIKGTFGTVASENWFQGAFFEQKRINNVKRLHDKASLVGFDASRSNQIYGQSDTVQPPAVTVLYIIKE